MSNHHFNMNMNMNSNLDATSHANDEVVEANQLIRERMQKRTCLGCQIFDSKAASAQKDVTPVVSTDPRCQNCKMEDQLTTRKVRPRPVQFPERAYLTHMRECPNKSWQGIVSVDRQLAKNAGFDFHHFDVIIWPFVHDSDSNNSNTTTNAMGQDLNAICFFRNAAIWEDCQHALRSILAQKPRVFFASEKGEQFHTDLVPCSVVGGDVCATLMYNSQAKCYVPEANHRLIKKGQAEAQRNRGTDSHSQKSSRRSSGKSQHLEAPHANLEETLSEGSDDTMEVGQEGIVSSHSHSHGHTHGHGHGHAHGHSHSHPAMAISSSSSLLAMQLPPPLQTSTSSDEKIAAANVLASFSSSINILAALERDYFPLLNQCYHLSTVNDATFLLRVMAFYQLAPLQFVQVLETLNNCLQLLKKNWEDAKSLMDNGSLPVLKVLQFVRTLAYFSMTANPSEQPIPAVDLLDDLVPRAQALNLKFVHHEPVSKLKANLDRIRASLEQNLLSVAPFVSHQELPFFALQKVWNQFLMVRPSENPFLPLDLDLDNLALDTNADNGESRKINFFIPDVNMDSFQLTLILFMNRMLDSNCQPNFGIPATMPMPMPMPMSLPVPMAMPMSMPMQIPLPMMGAPVQVPMNFVQMAVPVPMPTPSPTLQVPTASKPAGGQSPHPVSPRPLPIKPVSAFATPTMGPAHSPRQHLSAFSVCVSPPSLPSPLPQQGLNSMSHLCLPSPSPSSALSTPRQFNSHSAPNSPRPSPRPHYLEDGLKPNTSERPFMGSYADIHFGGPSSL